MRPADQVPHRQRAQRARLQQLGILAQPRLHRRRCPATWSSVNGDSMKSSSPWHSRSISSFLICAEPRRRDAPVVAERQGDRRPRADAAQPGQPRRRASRSARRTSPRDPGTAPSRAPARTPSISASSGSGMCSAAACGFSTTSAFRSCSPSLTSTVTMLDCDDRRVVGPAEHLDRVGRERPAELQRRRRAARRTRRTR